MKLFHATLDNNFEKFHHFTHFGTEKAAIHRISIKFKEKGSGVPTLMWSDLPVDLASTLNVVRDWGSHQPISLANVLRESFDKGSVRYQKFEDIRSHLCKLKNEGAEWREAGDILLYNYLRKLGIKIISYENDVEDGGETSYCFVERLNVSDFQQRRLSVAELIC